MAEQNLDNDETLNDAELEQVAGGGVVVPEIRTQEQGDKLRKQEQGDKLSRGEERLK